MLILLYIEYLNNQEINLKSPMNVQLVLPQIVFQVESSGATWEWAAEGRLLPALILHVSVKTAFVEETSTAIARVRTNSIVNARPC